MFHTNIVPTEETLLTAPTYNESKYTFVESFKYFCTGVMLAKRRTIEGDNILMRTPNALGNVSVDHEDKKFISRLVNEMNAHNLSDAGWLYVILCAERGPELASGYTGSPEGHDLLLTFQINWLHQKESMGARGLPTRQFIYRLEKLRKEGDYRAFRAKQRAEVKPQFVSPTLRPTSN